MELVLTAIVPLVLLLGLGAFLRRRALTDAAAWRGLEWMTYWVFTPALFIGSIAGTDLTGLPVGPLIISLAVPVAVMTVIVVLLRKPIGVDGPAATSLVQGSIRLNTYLGLVFAAAIGGQAAVATFALAAAVMVPTVNVLSVAVLVRLGDRDADRPRPRILSELATNPFILGCLVGLVLNLTGVPVPEFIGTALDLLAQAALACGTLAAGAAISFRVGGRTAVLTTAVSIVKLVVLPAAAWAIGSMLGMGGLPLAMVVLITALPTAPSSYVLASRMGGDATFMASITGMQTVLSVVTVPLVLFATGAAPL